MRDEEPIVPIDQDADLSNGENSNNEVDETYETRLRSSTAKKASSNKQPFTLHVSKSDNSDFDSTSSWNQSINLDTPVELPSSTSSYYSYSYANSSQPQIVSLFADFTSASIKRNYKGYRSKLTDSTHSDLVVDHSSCQTAQLTKQRKDVITLADCFTLFNKIEELSGQDYWYCSKCKVHQKSTKKFDLWKLPPVMVVHLKRFSYGRAYRDKIDTLVEFPLNDLDMSPYLINKNAGETKYNLIGVSNHYGSLGGGHCELGFKVDSLQTLVTIRFYFSDTAYAKNRCDGKWYHFDDSSVSSCDESHVCTAAAYMLIYLRKDAHDLSLDQISPNLKLDKSNSEVMDF